MITGQGSYATMILMIIWLAISLGFAIPTGISAAKRGMNSVGWGILTFFTWVTGLILFLLFAKPKADEVKCAVCGEKIPRVHVYCPFCGHRESKESAEINDEDLKGE